MIADPLVLLSLAWGASAVLMLALWWLQLHARNASIADVGWCLGLVAVVVWYAAVTPGEPMRRALVAGMVAIYGTRLGLYLLVNRILGHSEDARYQSVRRRWGAQEPVRMFLYFQLQALALAAFSLPPLLVMQNPHPPFHLWELAGVCVWGAAVCGEAVADWQLTRFRGKPWNRDRVLREGLWRYSRHPNYFFEWLHWWAYVVMALALPMGNWWLTLIGPAAMGWALVRVTGIPLAEAQALASRGEDYRDYQRTTSSFVPWLPRRGV